MAIIWGIIILVIAVASFVVFSKLRNQGEISHSLGLALLKIQLPRAQKEENEQKTTANDLREKIAVMEQVYSQFANITEHGLHAWLYGVPFFSLEIVVPHVGQEVIFYCSVPRKYASATEKLIQGVYPDATIEPTKDYTIFRPDSEVSAAYARAQNKFLPLKTYLTMDADPLGSIINAFSKVANDGEGLALQIVSRRSKRSWNTRLSRLTRYLREGQPLHRALKEANKSDLVRATKGYKTEHDKKVDEFEKQAVDETLVEMVNKKAQKILFETNIRVIAAAKEKARADSLIQELATPFAQYMVGDTNGITFAKVSGRSLQRLVYQFSFRTPDLSSALILSSEELASIAHLPNTLIGASHIAAIKAKQAPVPFAIPRAGLMLGINTFRGTETEIRMADEDRARHFYIIGQTGTGKTYFMRNMIVQDIEAGHGVCFIDPHGDMCEDILGTIPPERIEDVIYFNPGDVSRPMGMNMLEYDPKFPEQKTFIINELLEIFNKLYDMKTAGGPMFEQYFRNATALVMDDPASGNTLLEINRVFVDKKFRDYKLSRTNNPLVKIFWRDIAEKAGGEASLQNIVPYISSKFDSFLSNEIMRPIVAQEKSSFRLRDVMDNHKILLINLSKGRLGELNSSLIGLILVGKMLMAAFSRVDIPEKDRKEFYLYIDEFQNVTTNSIETILSEARKYKLALIIAHQFIAQLEEDTSKSVFGNVGSMAAFRVGAEDGEFLEKQFGPTFTRNDLINIDNRNCYVKLLINGMTALPFSMRTVAGKQTNPALAAKAKEYSRLAFGRDRIDVEKEVMEKFASLDQKKSPPISPF
ncbi:MAG: type IV secretion system DNA-binding domain-containing protein [bacterium]|nr:type IV secretion system DNA-binding domain-containing protein [bacterium]